jgi:hypothetical protein
VCAKSEDYLHQTLLALNDVPPLFPSNQKHPISQSMSNAQQQLTAASGIFGGFHPLFEGS